VVNKPWKADGSLGGYVLRASLARALAPRQSERVCSACGAEILHILAWPIALLLSVLLSDSQLLPRYALRAGCRLSFGTGTKRDTIDNGIVLPSKWQESSP